MSTEQDIATARAHHVFVETVETARELNDPVDATNEAFWQYASNILTAAHGMGKQPEFYAGTEMAALVELSKAIAGSATRDDWASAAAICERQFDELDGGEELGLGEFLGTDWDDDAQRDAALRKGMQFHRVPKGFQGAVMDVITQLMMAMPGWRMGRHEIAGKVYEAAKLPQPWASMCTYVIGAIAQRVQVNGREGRLRVVQEHRRDYNRNIGFH